MKTKSSRMNSMIIIIILLIFVIIGMIIFNKIEKDKLSNIDSEIQLEKINYVEDIIPDLEWESNLGVNEDDKVPTKEAAIKISQVVFDNLKNPKEKKLYGIHQIIFDSEKNIWIICYSYKDFETIGNGYNIAINKTTGEIEKVWADE